MPTKVIVTIVDECFHCRNFRDSTDGGRRFCDSTLKPIEDMYTIPEWCPLNDYKGVDEQVRVKAVVKVFNRCFECENFETRWNDNSCFCGLTLISIGNRYTIPGWCPLDDHDGGEQK